VVDWHQWGAVTLGSVYRQWGDTGSTHYYEPAGKFP